MIDATMRVGETCAAWNGEVFRFAGDRPRRGVELGLALAKCRSWTKAAELQCDWAPKTTQDYFDEGTCLFRMATRWSADIAQSS